jgi:hypothetical protein
VENWTNYVGRSGKKLVIFGLGSQIEGVCIIWRGHCRLKTQVARTSILVAAKVVERPKEKIGTRLGPAKEFQITLSKRN